MSKHNFLKYLAAILLLSVMISCSKKESSIAKYIPNDVGFMLTLDMKSFNEKGKLADFTKTKMYSSLKQTMSMFDPEGFKKIDEVIQNTDAIGLNLKSDFYLYVSKNTDFVGMLCEMKDKSKFTAFLKKFEKELNAPKEPEKIGDFLAIIDDATIFAYNDDVWYMLINMNINHNNEQLKEHFKKLSSLKPEESITANKDYQEFIKEKKDISVWFDMNILTAAMSKAEAQTGFGAMPNMTKLLSGSSFFMHSDFATDEIICKVVGKYSPELTKLIDPSKVYTDNFNAEMLKFVPADAFSVYTISINMNEAKKGLDEFYRLLLADMQPITGGNEQIEQAKIIMEVAAGVIDKLDGNIVYLMNDMSMKDNAAPDMYMGSNPIPEMSFAMIFGVKDVNFLDALAAQGKIPMKKEGNFYLLGDENTQKMYLGIVKNYLVLTTDMNIAKNIEAGEVANNVLTTMYKEQLSKGNFGYMNLSFDKMPQGLKGMIYNGMVPAQTIDKLNIFDAMIMETDAKNNTGTLRLKYKKTNTNAFLALIKMIDSTMP